MFIDPIMYSLFSLPLYFFKAEFTDMSVEETGTWTWSGWKLTVTTAGGNSFTGSVNK